jgi:hypothetical protein
MKVTRVIRNRQGFYLKMGGAWTTYFPDAEKFSDIKSVIETSKRLRLSGVDLVLVIHDKPSAEWDVVLPLADSGDPASADPQAS